MISRKRLLVVGISFFGFAANAALLSMSAGRVSDRIVTTREVYVNNRIENYLYRKNQKTVLSPEGVQSRDFIREITAVLIEQAIYLEAEALESSRPAGSVVAKKVAAIQAALAKDPNWRRLKPTNEELTTIVQKKLRAKDFIQLKINSASIPISDREAEDYFNANRLKFENLPFVSFRENIKAYLTKQQVDRRLKDWFELLQSKYRVRNFLTES